MIAVHFGAGNIGRGFIGQLLHEAGYSITFLDVNADLVDSLKNHDSYQVIETGNEGAIHTIDNFTALNSKTEFDAAVEAIAEADILTTSVGPNVLKFLAPLLVAGLKARMSSTPLVVMACENAIRATDILRAEIAAIDSSILENAVYANTAVDRIVPPQALGASLDVLVESFYEWVIDSSSLNGEAPNIPGAHFVSDLTPYLERKLFTVNTAHATLAYLGQQQNCSTIVQALNNPAVTEAVNRVLQETSQVLIRRHGFDPETHAKYVQKTLERFADPQLDDPVSRVGREPARKLSRHDRLIGPAAYLAEWGVEPTALLEAIGAALLFEDDTDAGVEVLHNKLSRLSAEEFVSEIMGINQEHSLAPKLTSLVKQVKLKNYS